jgi:dihydroneopterin aldolase
VRRDRIEVRGLRVVAVHGTLPHERDTAQPFELDLDVELDTAAAGASDRLEETVDYGEVVARAAGVVRDRSFLLLEALAEAVAGAVLDLDWRVRRVEVVVRKLRPPIAEDVASVGVRVLRGRAVSAEDDR